MAARSAGESVEIELRNLVNDLGGVYHPKLRCRSLGQCLAAVKTGNYAAVLPVHALNSEDVGEYSVIDADLARLDTPISLIWSDSLMEMMGEEAETLRERLISGLREEAVERGMEH